MTAATRPPVQYRGYFVEVFQYGRDWCAHLESYDGQTKRRIADACEAWQALDRALNLIDVLIEGVKI